MMIHDNWEDFPLVSRNAHFAEEQVRSRGDGRILSSAACRTISEGLGIHFTGDLNQRHNYILKLAAYHAFSIFATCR